MVRTPPPGTLTGTAAAMKSVDPATIKGADEKESFEIPASRRTAQVLEEFKLFIETAAKEASEFSPMNKTFTDLLAAPGVRVGQTDNKVRERQGCVSHGMGVNGKIYISHPKDEPNQLGTSFRNDKQAYCAGKATKAQSERSENRSKQTGDYPTNNMGNRSWW